MKKTILVLTLLLLSGCTVNYDLNYGVSGLKETISGKIDNSEITTPSETEEVTGSPSTYQLLLETEQYPLINDQSVTYQKSVKNGITSKKYNLTYTYTTTNFENSNVLNTCFDGHLVLNEDSYYYINAFGNFDCAYADKTVISVSTDNYVIENNADKVNGNKYIWYIDKNDTKDQELFIKIDKTNIVKTKTNILGFSKFKTIMFVILLVLSGIVLFIAKKNNINEM